MKDLTLICFIYFQADYVSIHGDGNIYIFNETEKKYSDMSHSDVVTWIEKLIFHSLYMSNPNDDKVNDMIAEYVGRGTGYDRYRQTGGKGDNKLSKSKMTESEINEGLYKMLYAGLEDPIAYDAFISTACDLLKNQSVDDYILGKRTIEIIVIALKSGVTRPKLS